MPDPLQLLLDVQDRDLVADQLRHRHASLPERLALAEQEASVARLDTELAELRERLTTLQRSQKRLEDEIATLEAKAAAENTRMYSGSISAPRELQALQEEIDGLVRRQRSLEDEVLDLLEAAEPLQEEIDRLDLRREALAGEADRVRDLLGAAEAEIDTELASVTAARHELAAALPGDLLTTYERLRERLGGIGVARLEGAQCTGCHLRLPATEVDALRRAAPDAVHFHEECGRILVR